jgi:hypothetical protein
MIANMSNSDFNMFYYKKRLLDKAKKIGFNTSCFILQDWDAEILKVYQKLLKFLKIANQFSNARLEKACERAYFYKQDNQETIKMVLKYSFDSLPLNPNSDIYGQYLLCFEN